MTTPIQTPATSVAFTNQVSLSDQLEQLQASYSSWKTGAYKTATDELYGLLDQCFALITELRASLPLRKDLNDFLKNQGMTVKANTGIERKVVSVVFGTDCKQTDAYSRVLRIAKAKKSDLVSMTKWLNDNGGIEGVRRSKDSGLSAAENAKLYLQTAEADLASASAIAEPFTLNEAYKPEDCGDFEFSVGEIRFDDDGKASLVYSTNKSNRVRPLLVEAGKEKKRREEQVQELADLSASQNARDVILEDLAP